MSNKDKEQLRSIINLISGGKIPSEEMNEFLAEYEQMFNQMEKLWKGDEELKKLLPNFDSILSDVTDYMNQEEEKQIRSLVYQYESSSNKVEFITNLSEEDQELLSIGLIRKEKTSTLIKNLGCSYIKPGWIKTPVAILSGISTGITSFLVGVSASGAALLGLGSALLSNGIITAFQEEKITSELGRRIIEKEIEGTCTEVLDRNGKLLSTVKG